MVSHVGTVQSGKTKSLTKMKLHFFFSYHSQKNVLKGFGGGGLNHLLAKCDYGSLNVPSVVKNVKRNDTDFHRRVPA